MGNHDVGRAMGAAAEAVLLGEAEPTQAQALVILDRAAEPWRGADAEFDDLLYDDTPLRQLVAIAFEATKEEMNDREFGDGGLWYGGPVTRFRSRYDFC